MAKDERKRQKSLAKKKKREIQVRKEANKVRNPTLHDLVKAMQRGAWYACYEIGGEQGLHNLMCVRNSSMGPICFAFLVDRYCLGIKNAEVLKSIDLARLSEWVQERDGRKVTPAYALKLITFAMEEAQKIGFAPHRTTSTMLPIFIDVDVTECKDTFEFGRDGKPIYISGPNESEYEQSEILNTLSKLGSGNYHFSMLGAFEGSANPGGIESYDEGEDFDEFDEIDSSDTIDSTATVVDAPSLR